MLVESWVCFDYVELRLPRESVNLSSRDKILSLRYRFNICAVQELDRD